MRKIISQAESKKKAKRNQLIVGFVLIGIMLFSIIGYSIGSNEDSSTIKITYNGLDFVKENGLWYATLGQVQFSFLYNPKEVMNVNSTINFLDSYVDKPLYISSENLEAENEISRNLFYNVAVAERIQKACLQGEICEEDLPIRTCSDNFIIIKKSNDTDIRQDGNCVFIEGHEAILTRLADGFLYKILGIQ